MKIELSINNASLKVEGIQDQNARNIINGFFAALGVAKQPEPLTVVQNVVVPRPPAAVKTTQAPKEKVKVPTTEDSVVGTQVKKVVEKINSERSLSATIGEMTKITPISNTYENVENYGIKDFDGVLKYQCKYWCDCGHHGKRWVSKEPNHVYCHECNSKLIVEPATMEISDDGLPVQDKHNNFFIAREVAIED